MQTEKINLTCGNEFIIVDYDKYKFLQSVVDFNQIDLNTHTIDLNIHSKRIFLYVKFIECNKFEIGNTPEKKIDEIIYFLHSNFLRSNFIIYEMEKLGMLCNKTIFYLRGEGGELPKFTNFNYIDIYRPDSLFDPEFYLIENSKIFSTSKKYGDHKYLLTVFSLESHESNEDMCCILHLESDLDVYEHNFFTDNRVIDLLDEWPDYLKLKNDFEENTQVIDILDYAGQFMVQVNDLEKSLVLYSKN